MTVDTADYNFITDRLAIGNVASCAVVTILATDRPGTLRPLRRGLESIGCCGHRVPLPVRRNELQRGSERILDAKRLTAAHFTAIHVPLGSIIT